MISKTQRTEWRKLAEGATEGPWAVGDRSVRAAYEYICSTHEQSDAQFMAASRIAVPLLLEAVEKMTECLETYVNPIITLSGPNAKTMAEDMKELISLNARLCLSQVYAPESEEKEMIPNTSCLNLDNVLMPFPETVKDKDKAAALRAGIYDIWKKKDFKTVIVEGVKYRLEPILTSTKNR